MPMRMVRHQRCLVWGLSVLLTLSATCIPPASSDGLPAAESEVPSAPWSYEGAEGPEHWGMLSQAYMSCEKGSRQSPIDIREAHRVGSPEELVFAYQSDTVRLMHTGHSILAMTGRGGRLTLNGRGYALRQFHFHEPSEHHIEGRAYAMELHLVHQDEAGRIAVVAVLLQNGEQNTGLTPLLAHVPQRIGQMSPPLTLNPAELLPLNTHHYAYEGSLTTPPCTEGVVWIVLKQTVSVSTAQANRFRSLIGSDARPVQALNQREIQDY